MQSERKADAGCTAKGDVETLKRARQFGHREGDDVGGGGGSQERRGVWVQVDMTVGVYEHGHGTSRASAVWIRRWPPSSSHVRSSRRPRRCVSAKATTSLGGTGPFRNTSKSRA